jgi:drug/metabolite transporter (DMT)-like permease
LFAQGIPFAFLFWGERRVSPGLAGIVNGTVPLWTFIFGLALGAESFTRRKITVLLLGFAGIAVICAPVLSFTGSREEVLGTAAVFVMALSYGVGTRLTRSILSGKNPADFRANSFHQNCASFVFLALISLIAEPWPSFSVVSASPGAVIAIVYLGVCSTAAAFLIYFHLIREWGAVRASAVTYVVPVVALFWDYVFFRTVPPPGEILGVMAVLAGVWILNAPSPKAA